MENLTEKQKTVIEKTAKMVVEHGDVYEAKILQHRGNDPQVGFLRGDHPLHAFYLDVKARYLRDVAGTGLSAGEGRPAESEVVAVTAAPSKILAAPTKDEFSLNFPDVPATVMDVMKVTALFVARNGHQFQQGLMQKESASPKYAFLRPDSPYFGCFSALVEQYRKIMLPQRGYVDAIKQRTSNGVLERLKHRADWEKQKEEAEKKAAEEREMELAASAKIDWRHFVLVETIDFLDEDEEMQEIKGLDTQMNVTSQLDELLEPAAKKVAVEVNADNDVAMEDDEPAPRVGGRAAKGRLTQRCPKCGQDIPIEEFTEHMKIELLDADGRKQRKLAAERVAIDPYASDVNIGENIARFAKNRFDKAAKQDDGYMDEQKRLNALAAANVRAQTVPAPFPAQFPAPFPVQAPVSQVVVTSKPAEIVETKPIQLPVLPVIPVMPPPNLPVPTIATEQQLKPEEFAEKNGGMDADAEVCVRVDIQDAKGQNWKHLGEIITVPAKLKTTVAEIKKNITDMVGIPPNKQKLSTDSQSALRDNMSLAYYNMCGKVEMVLKLKERGGRKK